MTRQIHNSACIWYSMVLVLWCGLGVTERHLEGNSVRMALRRLCHYGDVESTWTARIDAILVFHHGNYTLYCLATDSTRLDGRKGAVQR